MAAQKVLGLLQRASNSLAQLSAPVRYTVVGCSLGALYGVVGFPHKTGCNTYRALVSMYKGDRKTPMDLTANLRPVTEELMEIVKTQWDPASVDRISFFMTIGTDQRHIGSTYKRRGAAIGIPIFHSYCHQSEIELHRLRFMHEELDLMSPAGVKFLDSIILSKEAKLFAIGREVNYAHSRWLDVKSCMATTLGGLAYASGRLFHQRTLPAPGGVGLRLAVYSVIGAFYYTLYLNLLDHFNQYRDKKADTETMSMGPQFVTGAVEFYSKLLKRNQALRVLMESEGKRRYTSEGNDTPGLLRLRHVPITTRLDNVNKYAATKNQTSDSAEVIA